jgi:hypothetical protein
VARRSPNTSIFEVLFYFKILNYDKFKKKLEQEATLRNLSYRTRQSYWWHINNYARFIDNDPEQSGIEELRRYFQSMLTDGAHKPGNVKMGYKTLHATYLPALFCNPSFGTGHKPVDYPEANGTCRFKQHPQIPSCTTVKHRQGG